MPLRSTFLRVLVALRGILSAHPHRAWLCVDDLLTALQPGCTPATDTRCHIFCSNYCAHFLEKNVQFQDCLTWCGWSINFSMETTELTPLKTLKLKEQLLALLRSKRIKRKLLEQVLRLLIWATSLSLELRSWLAPLYADLRTPVACISVSTKLQSCASVARARHFYAAWLQGLRVSTNINTQLHRPAAHRAQP